MIVDFGSEPTTDPPDDGAWMWVGDRWVEIATDTGDGIPESLNLDDETDDEALSAEPLSVQVGDRVFLGSVHRMHMPGKHDQKSHGNKVGKKDLVQTKTGIGRYAYLQRKGTNNAHVGDVVQLVNGPDRTVADDIRGHEATVTGWIRDNVARLELADGRVKEIGKDYLKVIRTSQEIADDARGGDRAGNAKTILKGHYGDRLKVIGKETEMTRLYLNELAKVPGSHHKIVAKHVDGSKTGGIYIGHVPVTELSPTMALLKDQQPRGYAKGATFAGVGGVFVPGVREVAIGVGPHGSGSHSVAAHELGHALDDALTIEQGKEWPGLYQKIDRAIFTKPYFHPMQNVTGHISETFAELYSVWSTGGSVDDGIRTVGEPRDATEDGQQAAREAVLEAFTFFEGIAA